MKTLLDNPKFSEVVRHFENACRASREHVALANESLERFGNGNGTPISGVVRDHFPDEVKDRLRSLARAASSDAAYDARPKYVRIGTIRAIGRMVARRDGSGFYGPRG